MKRVIIVHGWEGSPEADWLPWLSTELRKLGCEVHVPEMPDTNNPIIGKWVSYLAEVVGIPDANTYFVGHSIGCQTILRYFETIDTPVGGAVFVAGWFNLENLENEEAERIAKPWLETPIDLEKVKSVLPKSTLVISDNDPYGALEFNKQKFAELGSKIVVLHDAGHITTSDGFQEAPAVLAEVQNIF